tara:strand:- start:86 stop:274 length:189 start_codon:yes stop_codon:yes gene_type:complete
MSHWTNTSIVELKGTAEKVCQSFSSRLDKMGDEAKREVSDILIELAGELHLNWKHLNEEVKE